MHPKGRIGLDHFCFIRDFRNFKSDEEDENGIYDTNDSLFISKTINIFFLFEFLNVRVININNNNNIIICLHVILMMNVLLGV